MIGKIKPGLVALLLLGFAFAMNAQTNVSGSVLDQNNSPLPGAYIIVDDLGTQAPSFDGKFNLQLANGSHVLTISHIGFQNLDTLIFCQGKSIQLKIQLKNLTLSEAVVESKHEAFMTTFNSLEKLTIYEAKKAELVQPRRRLSNLASNSARQVFAEVSGLNIWESDGAGLQLGIGGRGLNPNRTSNFNTRQNGYDISADPHGYPESYYSPPLQAVERIEILRGAAGLQFGPQFGGMINFELRESSEQKVGIISEQSISSWNGLSSFNQFGGTFNRFSYCSFVQYKKGDGWRENSQYEAITAFAKVGHQINEQLTLSAEYTYFHYLAKQAGGLTDTQFILNPNFSQRSRNWFRVDWNLMSATLEWKPNKRNLIEVKPFALIAKRQALGFLGLTSRIDPGLERDLIRGEFENYGIEARGKHRFEWLSMPQNLLFGARYFKGSNRSQQGAADSSSEARFSYIQSDSYESSDYNFLNENVALYSEILLQPNASWSFVPGIRLENLNTGSKGSFTEIVRDGAGNILPTYPRLLSEEDNFQRTFVLYGLGISRKLGSFSELFINYSRNYRGINFSDVRIENPKQLVSPDIEDEKGFNADIGLKTNRKTWGIDLTAFHLKYQNKIGNKLESRTVNSLLGPELFQVRQNLGDASIYGIEFLAKVDFLQILLPDSGGNFKSEAFINASWISAQYDKNAESSIQGNQVEFVPEWNIKTGVRFGYKNITIQHQFAYLSQQYTDATNAGFRRDPQGVIGEIPEYWIHDLSARITFKKWSLEGGVNNFLNQSYFTRRATGYPGPGIIPSDPRNFFVTLSFYSW